MGTGGERHLESYLTITPLMSSEEGRHMPSTGQFSAAAGEAVAVNFPGTADLAWPEAGGTVRASSSSASPPKENAEGSGNSSKVRLEQCLEAFTRCEELAQEDWAT